MRAKAANPDFHCVNANQMELFVNGDTEVNECSSVTSYKSILDKLKAELEEKLSLSKDSWSMTIKVTKKPNEEETVQVEVEEGSAPMNSEVDGNASKSEGKKSNVADNDEAVEVKRKRYLRGRHV